MTWENPNSISPSRMSTFLQCPLRFRFESIQKLRTRRPGPAAVIGTTIHAALELFMQLPAAERTHEALAELLEECLTVIRLDDDYLALSEEQLKGFDAKVRRVGMRVFEVMDVPKAPEHSEEGDDRFQTELRLEVDLEGWILRGIIDVLKWAKGVPYLADYKSGRAPSERFQEKAMLGLRFYSVMIERHFGIIPARSALLYLDSKKIISYVPTEGSNRAFEKKILSVRSAVTRACENDAFKPSTGPLCNYCDFKDYCPAHGGVEELALDDPKFVRSERPATVAGSND